MDEKYGGYAFLIGMLVAILAGLGTLTGGTAVLVLVILGLIVGFLNVTIKETALFLTATVALIVAGSANLAVIPKIGEILQAVLGNIVVFVAPAAIVVALKAVYALAAKK